MPIKSIIGIRKPNTADHFVPTNTMKIAATDSKRAVTAQTSNYPALDREIRDGNIQVSIYRLDENENRVLSRKNVPMMDAIKAICGGTLMESSKVAESKAKKPMWLANGNLNVLIK